MGPEMPDEERVKKILAEINMSPAELEEAVAMLRGWLAKQPHLPKSADDHLLKSFIIGSKSVERAKTKLDAYYSARVHYASPFFQDRDPAKIKWSKGQVMIVLPGWTPDHCKVAFLTMPHRDSLPLFDSNDYFRALLMFYDLLIRRCYMCSGVYIVSDMSNLTLQLTMKASISTTAKFARIFQECYPIRLKGFVAFNAPSLTESFFNTFVRPFLSQKLEDRIHLNSSDQTCLEKFMPLEMLPSDYGGANQHSDLLFDENKAWLTDMRSWFLKEGSEQTMEDFRPKPDRGAMDGTFRRLQPE